MLLHALVYFYFVPLQCRPTLQTHVAKLEGIFKGYLVKSLILCRSSQPETCSGNIKFPFILNA